MVVEDRHRDDLYNSNYYRLAAYWRNHQQDPSNGLNDFGSKVNLDEVLHTYNYEKALRSVLLDGLLTFEMTFKARFAYELANSGVDVDVYEYLYESYYSAHGKATQSDVASVVASIRSDINRSRDRFIKHYMSSSRQIPVWVGIEVLSFGTVSKMFALLADLNVKKTLARSFRQSSHDMLAANLYSLSVLRNVCAHGGRLWNATLSTQPSIKLHLQNQGTEFQLNSVWARILVLNDLLLSADPNSFEVESILTVVNDYPEYKQAISRPFLQ